MVQKKKPIVTFQGRHHDEKKKPIYHNPHELNSKSPQHFSTSNPTIYIYTYRIIYHHQVELILDIQGWLDLSANQCNSPYKQAKDGQSYDHSN